MLENFSEDEQSVVFKTTHDDENVIVSDLSDESQLKLEIIQSLLEPCDRITYGKKLQEAAEKLGKSKRTVQRLIKKWQDEGLEGLSDNQRSDKGSFRIEPRLQEFIIKTYEEGNKGSRKTTPKQVCKKAEAKAIELKLVPPSHMTVYRLLAPLIEKQEKKKSIRSPGWRGTQLSLKSRDGQDISVEYSNQVWQCDHTKVDVMLVDKYGHVLSRPWLTTVIDTYSRCIVGINLGYEAPSSQVVAMALRHAILPKHYGTEYELREEWGTYGKPAYFYTDGGKDFRSNHLKQISVELGFVCHLRDRPSEGGIVERPFKTFNTELFSTLKGYVGSNVEERSQEAEKEACLTLKDLERILVRYIVDNYNQRIDARMGDQTRIGRWESGLIANPDVLSERELDICLMKQAKRSVQRGGYLQFANVGYRGENMGGYAGENVIVRYDPRDITTILLYQQESGKESFLARAYAIDFETEHLSFDEARAISRKIWKAGKALNNSSIVAEIQDRDTFLNSKKTQKERQQEEQKALAKLIEPLQPADTEEEAEETVTTLQVPMSEVQVFDYEQLMEDYGF